MRAAGVGSVGTVLVVSSFSCCCIMSSSSILIEDGSNVTRCGDRTAGAFVSVGGCGGEGGLSFCISMLETSEMSSDDGCCRGGDR